MVRVKAEEFLRRLGSSTATVQESEGILLDCKKVKGSYSSRIQITYIDLKLARVSRKNADYSWFDVIQKKMRESLFSGKMPAVKIKYDMNRVENIEFLKDVELTKVLEIIDAIADKDEKYKYVDIEGKFIDQDTSCEVRSGNSGSVVLPYSLLSVQLLKDHLHGKAIKATIIGHESNGNIIDAFILREIAESEERESKEEEITAEAETEEKLELPTDKQKLVDELLAEIKT